MRIVRFDIETYNRTKGSGAPICTNIIEEINEFEMIVDEEGNPTRGGLIGYALAYAIMACFVGGMFFFL